LLQGNFTYKDEGLLDRTHIHFFTQIEIIRMFEKLDFNIISMVSYLGEKDEGSAEQELENALYQLPNIAEERQFKTLQYRIIAEKAY
jgi:hypothetical protein